VVIHAHSLLIISLLQAAVEAALIPQINTRAVELVVQVVFVAQ
jgi:hypothetical protein